MCWPPSNVEGDLESSPSTAVVICCRVIVGAGKPGGGLRPGGGVGAIAPEAVELGKEGKGAGA